MTLDENKAAVRRSIEAFNAGDLSVGDLHAEDLRRDLQQYVDTMPWGDHQVDITEMIAEGDRVVALIATQGVHTGEYQGMPPTGKRFTNRGVAVYRLEGGRVTAMETYLDSLTVVKQLGGTILGPTDGG